MSRNLLFKRAMASSLSQHTFSASSVVTTSQPAAFVRFASSSDPTSSASLPFSSSSSSSSRRLPTNTSFEGISLPSPSVRARQQVPKHSTRVYHPQKPLPRPEINRLGKEKRKRIQEAVRLFGEEGRTLAEVARKLQKGKPLSIGTVRSYLVEYAMSNRFSRVALSDADEADRARFQRLLELNWKRATAEEGWLDKAESLDMAYEAILRSRDRAKAARESQWAPRAPSEPDAGS